MSKKDWTPSDGYMKYADLNTRAYRENATAVMQPYKDKDFMYSEKKDGWLVIYDGRNSLYTKSGLMSFDAPEWFMDQLKDLAKGIALAGELVLEGQQASKVRSLVSRHGPWRQATFYVFDLPGKYARGMPFKERIAVLQKMFYRYTPSDFIKLLPVYEVKNIDDFNDRWQRITQCTGEYFAKPCFGEGVVLTDPSSMYEPRRAGKYVRVKLKKRADSEARVVGYNEKKSLLLQSLDNNAIFALSLGLTNVQKANIQRSFPIGTIVTYSYRSLYDSGKPKDPRLVRIRDAEDMPPPKPPSKKPTNKPSVPTGRTGQCKCTTLSGARCSRQAKTGQYCWQHTKKCKTKWI